MNVRRKVCGVLCGVMILIPPGLMAQTKPVTVPYLRAAAGSLPDRGTVSFDGVYLPDPGFVEAKGWKLRGTGVSRFSVRDPQSTVVFSGLYCNKDSKAFKDLVNLDQATMVHFTGYKGDGENKEGAIYITGAEVMSTPVKFVTADGVSTARTFRVTLHDKTSGTKTILANVILGKTYTVEGLSLSIEAETEPGAVGTEGSTTPP